MAEGLLLIALGLGILGTARAFRRDAGRANRNLWPRHPRFAAAATDSNVLFGIVVGLAAVVVGAVLVARAAFR